MVASSPPRLRPFTLTVALILVCSSSMGLWSHTRADLIGMIPFVDWISPSLVLSRLSSSSPDYATQGAEFRRLANEALTHPLYSCMSSPYPPPNGDLHYYYSWAPYWNPLPSCNLSDPLYMYHCNYSNTDGFINPDVELATQVRSLANVSSDSLTLALVGLATNNTVMLQRAALNLRLFYLDPMTLMLPDFRYAQVQRGANSPWPWVGRQYGIIDARAQIYIQLTSILLLNMSEASGWTGRDHESLSTWFSEFTLWLNTSEFGVAERDSANNHATWWQVQGVTYPFRSGDIAAAVATLSLYINNQFQAQINSTGEQPLEAARVRPFHYRCYNLQALIYIARVAEQVGIDLFHLTNKQGGSIQRAIDFVLDNVTPQPGTEDPTEFLPILYTAIEKYGDKDGRYAKGVVKFGGDFQHPPFWTLWRNVSLSQPTPTLHIFLLAGQSNSVGVNSDGLLPEDAPNPRIIQLVTCDNLTYLPADKTYLNISSDPLLPCQFSHVCTSCVSPWRPFARSLLPTLPATDMILLVPCGYGGTGFINGNWNAYSGGGFQYAVQMMQRAWLLAGQGDYAKYQPYWAGIMWHQGEADAGDNPKGLFANTSTYIGYMVDMVNAFRNSSLLPFTRPDLPLVAGQMLQSWMDNATHPLRQGVKFGSMSLTQYIPYTGFADSLGLIGDENERDPPDGELIHFTAKSQRLFGKRYYAAYEVAKVNSPLENDQQEAGRKGKRKREVQREIGKRRTPAASAD